MASVIDNGSTPQTSMEMPQWKRDLIMRRRAQAQAQAQAQAESASTSVNKQLDRVDGDVGACCCSRDAGGSGGGGAPVALGWRPPLGHQPTIAGTSHTSVSAIASGIRSEAHAYKPCLACSSTVASGLSSLQCGGGRVSSSQHRTTTCCTDMVHLHTDSDSSEELQYGPGIVSKLKNRYLSLTLRETSIKRRPSILRKTASLENLLDEDVYTEQQTQETETPATRLYESRTNGTNGNAKNVPSSNRYRGATRGSMKRARSVEAISRIYSPKEDRPATQQPAPGVQQTNGRPKSMHEDLSSSFAINPIITPRINKPKRLTPVITDREKPPADVVKQTKKLFEARPESRTLPPQQTGEVAAKVATYKTIIIQTKQANTMTTKPPIKQKPVVGSPVEDSLIFGNNTPRMKPTKLNLKSSNNSSPLISPITTNSQNGSIHSSTKGTLQSPVITAKGLQSPIPDVSMVKQEEEDKKTSSLSETPDLILHSSPVHVQKDKESEKSIVKNDIPKLDTEKEKVDKQKQEIQEQIRKVELIQIDTELKKTLSPTSPLSPQSPVSLALSKVEPLTLDITTYKSPVNNRDPVLVLSPREIEKNAINAACNGALPVVKPPSPSVINSSLPSLPATPPVLPRTKAVEPVISTPPQPPKAKARKSKQQQSSDTNCIVFKFTDRKDVPDYIGNDGRIRTQNVPMPKAGEGGFTLLPGTTIHDVFDEEELSLEGPPSPCDVQFINDNVLIDGKSSLSKKSKASKMRIQFVEAIPQVFEYPSEASMLVEESSSLNQLLGGTTVPALSGSTLANYTPKVAANEFQLGVTKTSPPQITTDLLGKEDEEVIEHDAPMLFSSGTNADILF